MTEIYYNSDTWMDGIDPVEFQRRLDDGKALEDWLYPKLENNEIRLPVPVADVAAAMEWQVKRVFEAVQAHYWCFITDGDKIDVDGE